MNICVIGLGYIGLPTALLLAKTGHKVHGIDIDTEKVKTLNGGGLPFEEKGLDDLYQSAKGNFSARTDFSELGGAEAIIVCVPTPLKEKRMDAAYLLSAVDEVSRHMADGALVVIESTVTPGTTSGKIADMLGKSGKKFHLAYCPERAIPGNTIEEMVNNDRVIGGIDAASTKKAIGLYSSFVMGKIHPTTATNAEITKAAENAYRDVNIAFANELALISEKAGSDVYEIIRLANRHPRVNIHQPGMGVGGHCLPIDPWFLVEVFPEAKLIPTAREINDGMVGKVAKEILSRGIKKVCIFGIAYKPDVDDTRESPGKMLKRELESGGVSTTVYDPLVLGDVPLESAVDGAECVVLSTAHSLFKGIDWEAVAARMQSPRLLVDGRGFFENPPAGFDYLCIGRGRIK